MKLARTLAVLFTAALFGAVNCKQVLSIEDAELDPSLTTGGAAGSAGTGGDHDSGGTAGTGGVAGDAGLDAPPLSLCDEYCDTLFANCTGNNEVYESWDACVETCNVLDEGNPDDRGVNTVHCRLAAAKTAATIEPQFYCSRAGPGGSAPEDTNPCAENCDSLCVLMERVCNNPDAGVDYFDTPVTCREECANVPDLGTLSTAREMGQLRGNSVQCRLIHVANSALEAADHCSHAAGRNTCIDLDGG
ncbi:MAG TPA: hypothetical protein VI072_01330 [Polyangiaceae bacterium]